MEPLSDKDLAEIVWSAENFIGRAGVGILVTRTEVLALVAEVQASRAQGSTAASEDPRCGGRACEYHGKHIPALHPYPPSDDK